MRGQAFSSIGQGIGVLGEALSPAGIAVYGNNGAASGDPVGVQGVTSSTDRGIGVRGQAEASTGIVSGKPPVRTGLRAFLTPSVGVTSSLG